MACKKNSSTPNWTLGMACALPIGIAVGTASDSLPLGIALALSLGVALAHGMTKKPGNES
ncbi:hypothetical protein HCN51_20910 [Nonomuraea sp. FMUSA5-5]|uniref:Glycine zipper-like domain-containing protein n=1 Tax=Nonomuraea composti TaxID=2720023 RepID=A0ABX1B233_9ACTN|nr:hypothetical protein [Nonomuraea sp. FMUSA5-5]NJP91890.1 hypothetical protein [Nonomuraea sp. FMUSA5-5]